MLNARRGQRNNNVPKRLIRPREKETDRQTDRQNQFGAHSPTSRMISFPSRLARSAVVLLVGRNLMVQTLMSWRAWTFSNRLLWAVRRPTSDAISMSSPCCSSSLDRSRRPSRCWRLVVISTDNYTQQQSIPMTAAKRLSLVTYSRHRTPQLGWYWT